MWTETEWGGSGHNSSWPKEGFVDFWDTDRPARHLNGTGYEEDIFRYRRRWPLDYRLIATYCAHLLDVDGASCARHRKR